jgi:uncharacterized protein YabN with tetrapyrrole methylase and pyrophosphatase domain
MVTAFASRLGVDAEDRLRDTIEKVDARFRYVEDRLRERGQAVRDLPLDDLLAIWNEAKALDRKPGPTRP